VLINLEFGNDVEGFSGVFQFTSAKPLGPDTPVSFIAIGDVGLGPAPGLPFVFIFCYLQGTGAEQTIQRSIDLLNTTDLFMHYGGSVSTCSRSDP
jgi:hypothetical protein